MPNESNGELFGWFRKFGRDPLIPIAVFAVGGIVVGDRISIHPSWIGGATLLALFASLLWRIPGRFCLIAAMAFAFSQTVAVREIRQFPFFPNLENDESIRIRAEGIVVSEPNLLGSGESRRCLVRVEKAGVAGRSWACRHQLPVTFSNPPGDLAYGDRVQFSGLLESLDTRRSPGAFAPDRFYYRSAGATGEIRVQSGDFVRILETGEGNPLIATAIRSRKWIESAITRGLETDPESGSLIKAMVLGAREDTPEHIEEQFRLSGATHVFAVSGLHVGIFGAILWWILRWLRVPKRWAILVIIPAILFYAIVTGLRPSAVRAAVMGTIVLAGFAAERRPRLLNSLAFAAILILAFNPQQLFLPGFQLSFAVLTSIALFADGLARRFQRPFQLDPLIPRRLIPRWRRGLDRITTRLGTGLGVSIAAWFGSAVLIALYFQILTPIAVIANLFLVPLAFCVLGIATISTLLSLVRLGFLAPILNQINASFAQLTTFAATLFASVPGGHVHVPPNPLQRPPPCRVTLLESGPGGISTLVSVHPSRFRSAHWLIDPGDPAGFSARVQPLLRHYGINRLQSVVLSHGDYRHTGAAGTVLRRFPTGAVIESHLPNRSLNYQDLSESLARTGAVRTFVARGDRIPIEPDTVFEVLYPPSEVRLGSGNADDRCLVLRLNHRGWKLLCTFDGGFHTAKWFEENRTDLRADIWVKGWHSADRQGFESFLEEIRPKAIVTAQRDFPAGQRFSEHQQSALDAAGIQLFDLEKTGAITLEFSEDRLILTPFVTGSPIDIERP